MKQILTILLIITTTIGFSQNKLHFGVQANGNFTTGIPSDSYYPSEFYKGIETFSFCYSAGGTVEYDLAKKWSLQSGVYYRKSGDRSKVHFIDLTVNSGFTYPLNDPTREGPYAYKFKYQGAEIPLNVYFSLTDHAKIGIGGSLLYNWKAKSQKFYNLTNNPDALPIFVHEKYNFLVNLNFQYKINKQLFFEVKSQYFLTETFADDFNMLDVPRNYLSLGLSVGYNFN